MFVFFIFGIVSYTRFCLGTVCGLIRLLLLFNLTLSGTFPRRSVVMGLRERLHRPSIFQPDEDEYTKRRRDAAERLLKRMHREGVTFSTFYSNADADEETCPIDILCGTPEIMPRLTAEKSQKRERLAARSSVCGATMLHRKEAILGSVSPRIHHVSHTDEDEDLSVMPQSLSPPRKERTFRRKSTKALHVHRNKKELRRKTIHITGASTLPPLSIEV